MSTSLEVSVDAPTCISSGYCRNSVPAVFGADDKRKAVVLASPVDESPELWEAMEGCPVEAISARNAATGEQVFP
jgi:ferredoxin